MIQAFTQEENKISVWSISNGSISSQSFENAALPPVDDLADIAVVFDYKALCRSEEFFRQLPPEKVFDIKLACYVKDPACSAESLAECAARFLPPETTPENDGGKLLALYTLLADEMEKNPVFRQLEMPLSPVLAAMEMRGIILDKAALLLFKEKLEKSIVEAQNAVFSAAGKTFNIN